MSPPRRRGLNLVISKMKSYATTLAQLYLWYEQINEKKKNKTSPTNKARRTFFSTNKETFRTILIPPPVLPSQIISQLGKITLNYQQMLRWPLIPVCGYSNDTYPKLGNHRSRPSLPCRSHFLSLMTLLNKLRFWLHLLIGLWASRDLPMT